MTGEKSASSAEYPYVKTSYSHAGLSAASPPQVLLWTNLENAK